VPQTVSLIRGRYRLEERIAAGAVGQVWRATDQVLQRPVAVKLLRPGYSDHPETLARFREEARLAGSLSHPGIAQVYDYGEEDAPYLVMELVDGPSLAGILDHGPLDPIRTADVIAQAAAGLAAAHRAGLVHRDVKPENLLLGRGRQVKITDFGIAHATGSAPLTGSGIVMGTAAYLAPERARGAAGSPASDLYSLGIVGYECLTGIVPFDGTRADIVAGHLHQQLPPLPGGIPSALADLIRIMTDKDPAMRPATAVAVAECAGEIRDAMLTGRPGEPHVSRLAPTRPPTKKAGPSRRRRALAGAAAAAVAAGLAGWLVPGLLANSPSGGHPAAQAAPARSNLPTGSSPTLRTVQVNASALVGRPLGVVLARLRALGLQPLPQWTRSTLPTGTVMQVMPDGPVTPGSTILVLAGYRSAVAPGPTAPPATAPSATASHGKTRPGHPAASPSGSSPSPASSAGSSSPPSSAGTGSAGNSGGGLLQLPGTLLDTLLP
jgi:tRNA A-37 threonylcarbamoyl transferase component Bud32